MTEYRLLIAHTLIEALREQHPGLEHIDNERGDCWLPGGSTPQSAGCIIDICAIAQDIESEVLSAAPPAPTMATAAWGNGVPWAGDDPRWDDVRLAWQARANECVYDHGRMDISDVEDCIGIALVRAFALTAPPAPTREAIEALIEHHVAGEVRGPREGWIELVGVREAADAILALLGRQS